MAQLWLHNPMFSESHPKFTDTPAIAKTIAKIVNLACVLSMYGAAFPDCTFSDGITTDLSRIDRRPTRFWRVSKIDVPESKSNDQNAKLEHYQMIAFLI